MTSPDKPRWPDTFWLAPQITFVVMSLVIVTVTLVVWSTR
jgi:hypothetical protein